MYDRASVLKTVLLCNIHCVRFILLVNITNFLILTLKTSQANILLLFLSFVTTIFSCADKSKKEAVSEIVYSKNQQYLFDLIDNYKTEYFATQRQDLKEIIQHKYLEKLRYFLVDSLGRYIDSINVTVDTVIQEGWLVTTQFHSRDIEFKYGMEFKDNMDSRNDSLYQWMRSLKPKSNLTVNFILLGSGQLNYPDDSTRSLVKIFALAEPLNDSPR